MELKELYKIYGELMIQFEILQGRINETKKRIAEAMQQPTIIKEGINTEKKK